MYADDAIIYVSTMTEQAKCLTVASKYSNFLTLICAKTFDPVC